MNQEHAGKTALPTISPLTALPTISPFLFGRFGEL
jgi:hypothetical protein